MKNKAFTLIELLIVVAIIAILAAIAVPNFLEAQTRAKVSRVRADMRTTATALGAYYVDFNRYPYDHNFSNTGGALPTNHVENWFLDKMFMLTTPIAYLTSVNLADPFFQNGKTATSGSIVEQPTSFKYFNLGYNLPSPARPNWGDVIGRPNNPLPTAGYVLKSNGPDGVDSGGEFIVLGPSVTSFGVVNIDRIYDPTNGTVSDGDIIRSEGSQFTGE